MKDLESLRGKRLGCHCKPNLACHGDVLVELLERKKMRKIIFAGIGSRNGVPDFILKVMEEIGYRMARAGHLLRSGAAESSDSAFESGCDRANGAKEIFLPWKLFNKHLSPFYNPPKQAFEMAAKFHPAWNNLTDAVKKLMSRNTQIVLGKNLDEPAEVVLCWTYQVQLIGGTAMALRLAESKGIPIINLAAELKEEVSILGATSQIKETLKETLGKD